ncbi:25972_t:CDS:2, partial [Racocetra persica]
MSELPDLLNLLNQLQNLIPPYVLGSLPAIATTGATPYNSLTAKLICTYWLQLDCFTQQDPPIRPFGHYARDIEPDENQDETLKFCVAEASVLDRLSLVVSVYYILIGTLAGIAKVVGPCMPDSSYQDWPYIPLMLIWTLPIICIRIVNGNVVDRMASNPLNERNPENPENPNMAISINPISQNNRIRIQNHPNLKREQFHTFIIALASATIHWVAVILAYFTRP